MMWLLPCCLGLPKNASQTLCKSVKRTLAGSDLIFSSIFSTVLIINGITIGTIFQDLELVQYILDCGWDFNRNSMGDTGRLVSEVVFLGLGLVDRCGNSVL